METATYTVTLTGAAQRFFCLMYRDQCLASRWRSFKLA